MDEELKATKERIERYMFASVEGKTAGSHQIWLPSDYVDEIIPPPRASPDAWIIRQADGTPALDCSDVNPDSKIYRVLVEGEVVKFTSSTGYGRAVLTIDPDGGWQVDRDLPPEATHVCAMHGFQLETLSGSVDDVVAALNSIGATPGEFELSYCTCSHDIPFQFDAAAGCFRQVAHA